MSDQKKPDMPALPDVPGIDLTELAKVFGELAGPVAERLRGAAEIANRKREIPPSPSWRPERRRRRRMPQRIK